MRSISRPPLVLLRILSFPSFAFPFLRFTSSPFTATSTASMASTSDKNSTSAADTISVSPSSAVDFLTLCHRLKITKRAGWVKRNVENPESIADHMYRMGLMALISADLPGLDRDKCIKMAIVHDLAEAIVGDITPHDGVSKEEKNRKGQEAINTMCNMLGGGPRGTFCFPPKRYMSCGQNMREILHQRLRLLRISTKLR